MVVQHLRNTALKAPQLLQIAFKMPSYSQRSFVFVCSLMYLTGTVITQDQVKMTTVLGSSATFTCTVDVTAQASWRDVANNNLIIYSMNLQRQPVKSGEARADNKYLYYTAALVDSTQFNLQITSVNVTDVGVLECIELPSTSLLIEYTIAVEGKVEPVTIDCISPCDNFVDGAVEVMEATVCQCTCSGNGGYPNGLLLEWNKGSPGGQVTDATSSGPYGTYDFSRNVTFTLERNYSPLICQVDGYTEESITGSADIRSEVSFNVLYAPNCTLEVKTIEIKDSCNVELTCSCEGNPEISENGYKYFMDTSPIDGSTRPIRVTVPLEPTEEVTFTCSGSNTVGNGSAEQLYTCKSPTTVPSTAIDITTVTAMIDITTPMTTCPTCHDDASTTSSTTTEMAPPPSPTKGSSSIWWISIPIVAVVVLICVGVAWWYFKIRHKPPKSIGDKTDGNGMPMSEAPEYAAVDKPLKSEPKPAPRSSQLPPNNSTEKQELQYADIDHSNRTPSNQIRQPAEAPTEYATVKSVIV